MKNFGERLRNLRKNQGITQDALAEYLNISYQAVSKWENGMGFPEVSLLPAIANFFDVTSDYLLGISKENNEGKIAETLAKAREFTHTGEIEKSISIIEEALKYFPNEHRLLCDLIEYKLMRPSDDKEWLDDIEAKANLILRDCNIDKIRYKTIGDLAFAYSFAGKQEKVAEVIQLLPEVPYSKSRLLSLTAPAKERAKYKPDCILRESELMLSDISVLAKHNIFWGDALVAVDICKRTLRIIDSIGAEGYLLYYQARAYLDLMLAYGKLQETEELYFAGEKLFDTYVEIEKTLSAGAYPYTSPLLNGLVFSKEQVTYRKNQNSFEFYLDFLNEAKLLKPYIEDERFINLLDRVKAEIVLRNTVGG